MAWLRDEFFSPRPAHMAAFLSGLLDPEPQVAISLTRLALGADPDDALRMNTLAFYLASAGQLPEADKRMQWALQQHPGVLLGSWNQLHRPTPEKTAPMNCWHSCIWPGNGPGWVSACQASRNSWSKQRRRQSRA